MRVNTNRQGFYGVAALTLQYLTENEDLVEDEELKKVVLQIKSQVKAPLRQYFLSNPDLRVLMARLLPALEGEATSNTMIEILSERGDQPSQKDRRIRTITKRLLSGAELQGDDFEYICEQLNITKGVEYKKAEPKTIDEKNMVLSLKYLDGQEQ